MSRFLIGLGLMGVLLGLGLYSAHAIKENQEPIARSLEQAAREVDLQLLEDAQQAWDAHWHGTATISDHAPMDEIDGLFSQAKAYAQQGNTDLFCALCLKLAQLIRATADAHQPAWWNFL